MVISLKQLAVAGLQYLDLPWQDNDIALNGQSYADYQKAKNWANLAAQELADLGPWPWLAATFANVTLQVGQWRADMPADVRTLLSTPSYDDTQVESGLSSFQVVTLQQLQDLRSGTIIAGIPCFAAIVFDSAPTPWAAATAYNVGDSCGSLTAPTGFRYGCTQAGTTGANEPTWPLVVGNTVVDGGVEWTCQPIQRIQLAVHPPADEVYSLNFAYARALPLMAADTDVPQMPDMLHRIVQTGTCAHAEELQERNWGGGARQAFAQQMQAAWLRASPSTAAAVSLKSHNHMGQLRWPPCIQSVSVRMIPLP